MITKLKYGNTNNYHPDHIGLISELMKQKIKLLLLDTQVSYIHFADDIFARDKRLNYKPIEMNNSTIIRCDESRNFLLNIGINGEIVVTPSHSEDSVSLIMDNGECFVGDLEPIEYIDGYEHNGNLQNDWDLIMSHFPKVINYAHATPEIYRGDFNGF